MTTVHILILLAVAVSRGSAVGLSRSTACSLAPAGGISWTYPDDDLTWDAGTECGNQVGQQTPIDLIGGSCGEDVRRPTVRLNKNRWRVNIHNNGRGLSWMFDCFDQTADNGASGPLTIIYKPLQAASGEDAQEYHLEELHFHIKSEHVVEGRRFPSEVHMKFKTDSGDYAVLGVPLITAGSPSNGDDSRSSGDDSSDESHENGEDSGGDRCGMIFPTFGFESKMRRVRNFNEVFEKTINIKLLKNLVKKALKKVYLYTGSLTTPPCSLGLPWIVSAKPACIEGKFLRQLKRLRDETGKRIKKNYRPLQQHTDQLDICLH